MKKPFPKFAALMLALVMVLCCMMACTPPEPEKEDPKPTEPTLSSITLDDTNVKKDYKVGEKFDPTGLVVTAVYSDESKKVVAATDYTYSPNGELKETDTQITVTYQKKRATISITVVDDTLPAAAPTARWITDWKKDVDPFDLNSWLLPEGQPEGKDWSRLVAPAVEADGSMKITGASRIGGDIMGIVNEDGKILNPTHNKADAGHDDLIDQEIVYSMNLKATGHFGILLFCTTGAAWDNTEQYRSIMVEFNNGEVSFRMQRPGDEVVATGKAAISATEFTRVDFTVTRKADFTFALKLFVGGFAVKLTGSNCADGILSSGINGYGQNIEFVALDESTLWLDAPHTAAEPEPEPQPGEEIPEIEGVTARWIGSWQKDDKFFDPTSWMNDETNGHGADTLAAPTLEADGSLKFTSFSRAVGNYMAVYQEDDSTILNPVHHDPKHEVLKDQPIVYSMLLKTEGHFGMMLFAGSNVGWSSASYRALYVEYQDGKFSFKEEKSDGAVFAEATASLSAEKFTRVDFVFTRKTEGQNTGICEMKFYVNGQEATLTGSGVENGTLQIHLRGYGQHIEFVALDDKALWVKAPDKKA